MPETHLYRLWHGNDNNRAEIARFKAIDAEAVADYVKKDFLAHDTEITNEFGDEISQYLEFDLCKTCRAESGDNFDDEDCEYCEKAEWVQIEQDDDIEADFKTIYGTNDYYDLTNPEGEEKAPDWAPELKTAWEKDIQGGVEALIAKTVEEHPELAKSVDSELLRRGRRALKGGDVE